jgi:hypothetical protein
MSRTDRLVSPIVKRAWRLGLTAAAAIGLVGFLTTVPSAAAQGSVQQNVTPNVPSGGSGTTIDPLQYNCAIDHPSCGNNGANRGGIGESFAYLNGAPVEIVYTENWYCDANVSSAASTGCEVGAGPSANPSASSSGGTGTSLGNTTHGDILYIPVPLFAHPPATQCPAGSATVVCIDHPKTVDLSRLSSILDPILGTTPSQLDNVPIPAHNHVIATRNGGRPEWWNVEVVATTDPATFNSLNSLSAIDSALSAHKAAEAPSNIFLFFQVLSGTVPTSVASNPANLNTFTFPPGPGYSAAPAPSAPNQFESGSTFNNLKYDCGQTAPNCENIGIAHGWVGGTPGAPGEDAQLLYSMNYFCGSPLGGNRQASSSGGEVGAPGPVPPGVGDTTPATAANSAPGASGGNGQIDPLYIPVPLGFTPTYTQCPSAITCIDHPMTVDLSNIAKYLPGNPSPAAVRNVPLPSHDHVIRTRNGDDPEWWNVEVVPVTSQAALNAIEARKNLTAAQEEPFNPTSNPGGAIDTNVYLWFQTLPGQAVPTPGPVQSTCSQSLASGAVVASAALPDGTGYVETDKYGDVAVFGAAACYGSLTGTHLNAPIVGIATDRNTGGYWLVGADGGVFSFNAPFLGSEANTRLNKPIVDIATDLNSRGYYLVAADGGVFSFGEPFHESAASLRLNKPIVGMAVDPAPGIDGGTGYWLVAADGGVFSFDAPFDGSAGNLRLNAPVVSMSALSDGSGYRLFASDGGVFDYNAPFYGSAANIRLNRPVIGSSDDSGTDGYWLFASDGGVFNFNAPFYGSAA